MKSNKFYLAISFINDKADSPANMDQDEAVIYADEAVKALSIIEPEAKETIFTYRDSDGNIDEKKVLPLKYYIGSTEQYTEKQCLLVAFCLEEKLNKIFAVKNILEYK